MNWEYKYISLPRGEHADGYSGHEVSNLQAVLDECGMNGWELTHMSRQFNTEGFVKRTDLIFRRPLTADD